MDELDDINREVRAHELSGTFGVQKTLPQWNNFDTSKAEEEVANLMELMFNRFTKGLSQNISNTQNCVMKGTSTAY